MELILPGIAHIQNIHPLIVHFPLAFFPGAALMYALALVFRSDRLEWAGFWMLMLGTVGGVAAAGTGLYAEEGVMVARSVREKLLDVHEVFMLVTVGIAAVTAVWALRARPFPKRMRPLFCLLFLVLLGVMTKGADYGGRMVFDYNAGGDACGQPIEFTK